MKHEKKGGATAKIPWDYGGTQIQDLPSDIIGVIVHTINTVVGSVDVVTNIVDLPSNMGTAFSEPNAPNPDNISIT